MHLIIIGEQSLQMQTNCSVKDKIRDKPITTYEEVPQVILRWLHSQCIHGELDL